MAFRNSSAYWGVWRWVLIGAVVLLVAAVIACIVLIPPRTDRLELSREEVCFTSLSDRYTLTVSAPDGSADSVIWSSSDEGVVTVSRDGVLTPIANGSATVTVRAKRGSGEATCRVTVAMVESIVFVSREVSVSVGRQISPLILITPQEIPTSELVFTSSDLQVAAVDESGTVTGIGVGTARITCASVDGTVSDSLAVTVTAPITAEGMAFSVSEFEFESLDDELILTPIFTPSEAFADDLIWISTDPTVASVDEKTGRVTPLSNGVTTVIARSKSTDLEASCTVTVRLNVPLTGLRLEKTSYAFADYGQTYLISPTFEPLNASNKTVIWSSSDPSVATVSAHGLVTSVKNGTAVISLTTEDGGFRASFTVTVKRSEVIRVTGVKLNSYAETLSEIGKTCRISASVVPSNATNQTLTYVSKNTSVASVSSDGTVTAKGYGTTQIEVRSADGGFTELFVVTVSEPIVDEPVFTPTLSEDVHGVWVASVANLDFPSSNSLTAAQMKAEIDAIFDNVVKWGLNTVYFQVRPSCDALYRSDIFPSSAYLVKNQGDELPLDVLEYAIEAAHARGLKLHAWINPYRVTNTTTSTDSLAATNPAKLHPEWVRSDGTKLYFDPGIPEVRQLVLDGVMEIVRNYDVDGIHFDDYFYPYDMSSWDDSSTYAKYGNGMSVADWRRENVNLLIQSVYRSVKAYDASVQFGISPAAVWAVKSSAHPDGVPIKSAHQTYSEAYADTKKWVEEGWLDYICPQVYFQFSHSTAPFQPIVEWWNNLVKNTNVRLYIGIAVYKCETVAAYSSGTEIPAQLDLLDSLDSVSGAVFYRYTNLKNNSAGSADQIRERYYVEPISTELVFDQPSQNLDSSYKSTYIIGISDPNYPLYADGNPVTRTEDGYFAYYVKISSAKTVVRFTHKGKTVDYVITRSSGGTSSSSSYLPSFGFAAGSFSPTYDFADASGMKLTFSCVAPAGATVYVKIGNYVVDLTTETKKPSNGKYLKATYTGSLTLPQTDGENETLGYAVFYASMDGESVFYAPGCLIEVINDPSSYVMEVTQDKSDIRPNLQVDPDLYFIATKGARVGVQSKANGVAKLTNGMYMSIDCLTRSTQSLSTAVSRGTTVSQSNRHTVLSLSLTERVFHTVWLGDDAAEITLYGVKGDGFALPTLGTDPLFSDVSVRKIDDTTVTLTLKYKKTRHIYGYYCTFDGTTLRISFRNPAALSSSQDRPLEGIVISLDPGHSQSSGAVRTFNGVTMYESDLNLRLSQRAAEILRSYGATVVLTHEGEQTYSLDELIVRYRALSPDVNVSVHFNSVDTSVNPLTAKGTYTYWCYGNSRLLADVLLDSFTADTGLKKNSSLCGYYKVSRLCEFPSILFETAFISNPDDFAYFTDDAKMQIAAQALADGILAFFREQNA